ncbi:hypothetical protein BDV27DRAFT_145903 [Aspergillus caelatus]|uniref:F-box domain-containing protein n=1 Tax=Aspergillus caelatus TaxID=61420 RepID=A0A5N7A3C3_9EURO|nr:uncharacterized protein BDV27DRAFT_145903 [Aspergillus caelatus]KAE8363676.1 hypothetical protein BDV27DRAFT_145903 [Aspergillus caelatus]
MREALCSFRLTCKPIYDYTLPQFYHAYLETAKTELSLASIQRLDALSQNLRLCPHVHSLDISGMDDDILGSELKWERHASGLIVIPQESIQQWQNTLLRLVNCQSFRLYKHFTLNRPSPPNILTPSDTITILLSIVATIKRPLRGFSILFNPQNCGGRNLNGMSRVDKGLFREPKFRHTMDTEDTVDFVTQLIQHTMRLQRLRIDADYGDHLTTLMSRLYPAQPTLRLRELTLETAHVGSSHALNVFLASFKQNLTNVSFAAIQLDSGEWASVLRTLSKKFPSLTEDSTYVLVRGQIFSYTDRKLRQGQRTLAVAYSGRSVDHCKKLADFVTSYKATD